MQKNLALPPPITDPDLSVHKHYKGHKDPTN